MNQRKFTKRGGPRRRRRSLRQPIDLMQLMRRRSRYRPYSVDNPNNRSAIPNITNVNSRNINRVGPASFFPDSENYPTYRLSRSRYYDFFSPQFNAFDGIERQDMAVNAEMPCCAFHPSCSATENPEEVGILMEYDIETMLLEDNELQDQTLNSFGSLENTNEDKMRQPSETQISADVNETKNVPNNLSVLNKQPNAIVPLAASKSNESKSQMDSSTEASGSSISYTERGHHSRKQNLSDCTFLEFPTTLEELNYGEPQVNSHMHCFEANSLNSLAAIDAENFEESTRIKASSSSISYAEKARSFTHEKETENFNRKYSSNHDSLNDHVSIKSLSNIYELSDPQRAKEASSESAQFEKSSSENFNIKDSLKAANTASEQSLSQNLSNISNTNMIFSMELPQSSSDSLNLNTTTSITFVGVHSNTSTENNASDSSLNNEEDQTTAADIDTKAGGDGSHNDSVILIEYSIRATINPDNEDTNAEEEDRYNEDT